MAHKFEFGRNEVACSGGLMDGHPALVFGTRANNPPGTSGEDFINHPETVIITLPSYEAVTSVMQILMDSVGTLARQQGVLNPDEVLLPLVSTKRFNDRVNELLAANNRYQQEARDARQQLHEANQLIALLQKDNPVKVSA